MRLTKLSCKKYIKKLFNLDHGNHLKREEAIALLKKIAEERILTLKWISLVKEDHGWEIHIKPESGISAGLKPILEKHGLILKEAEEELIICRKHT